MGKRSGPRRGSLAFYPRKRAKRVYPTVKTPKPSKLKEDRGIWAFAGYKAGMTHLIINDLYKFSTAYGQQRSVPATILECPSLFVFGVRCYKKSLIGLKAVSEVLHEKLPKELGRTIILPKKYSKDDKVKKIENVLKEGEKIEFRLLLATQPKKIKLKKKPEIFEISVTKKGEEGWKYAQEQLGKELDIGQVFADGDFIDVTSITTGKGIQGPVKRFGIKIQRRKAKKHRRMPGSIGAWNPNRVLWTVPMAGQLGFQRRTEYNKRILKIGDNGSEVTPNSGFRKYGIVRGKYIIVEGSVPGPKKRLIVLRHAIRARKEIPLPTIIEISQRSQQGL